MELHPRTIAASYRDRAKALRNSREGWTPGGPEWAMLTGKAAGLDECAEDMERRADAEFDRVMAEAEAGRQ